MQRNRSNKDNFTNPLAVATRHSWVDKQKKCTGSLHRTECGADRLSERMGRIVVVCDVCDARYSLSVTEHV